jgi:AraC family transcriptional regulator
MRLGGTMSAVQQIAPFSVSYQIEAHTRLADMEVEVRYCDWGTPSQVSEWLVDDVICMSLSAQPAGSQVRLERLQAPFVDIGYINFFPGGQTLNGHSTGGMQRLLLCRFPSGRLQQLLERDIDWSAPQMLAGLNIRDPEVRGGLGRIAREMATPGLAAPALIEALGAAVLIDLGRYLDLNQSSRGENSGKLAAWQVRRISDYVDTNLNMPRLADLAQLCGISVRHLVRAFKASTGQTVHRFLAAQQLQKARMLLEQSDRPLKVIAAELGFQHPASFSVAFRRACGETPSAFRNRIRT